MTSKCAKCKQYDKCMAKAEVTESRQVIDAVVTTCKLLSYLLILLVLSALPEHMRFWQMCLIYLFQQQL